MRILLTNDDGYDSEGLHAVADLFCGEHDLAVVAPNTQKSGYSHSLSMNTPVSYRRADGYDYPVYALDGTPVDCVKFAYTRLFPSPDIVISGINRGRNVGSDIMYSGTVSAASEGAYLGMRSFALSLYKNDPDGADWKRCAKIFKDNFEAFCAVDLPVGTLLNINFPFGEPVGIKLAKMGICRAFDDAFNPHTGGYLYKGTLRPEPSADSDEMYCGKGYVTVTPLTIDRTDYATLSKLEKLMAETFKI